MERPNEPATVLEGEIRRRHWSREETLDQLARTAREMRTRGYALSLRQLDRWLSGEVGMPRGPACRVAERLFGRSIEVLLGPPASLPRPPTPRGQVVDVDVLTRQAARSSRDHARRTTDAVVDIVSIELLQMEVRRLARGYASTPPFDLLTELVDARDHTYALLEHTRRPADLADLYLIVGQLCGLAATTAWDLGDPEAADDLGTAAWAYGQMCGHDTLRAWVRSVQATVAFWSGRPAEGLRFVDDGLRYANGSVAVRLHGIAARAWTLIPGSADNAINALRRADIARNADQCDDEMSDGIGGEFAFPAARQALCAGAVHIGLGDGGTAARYSAEALALHAQTPADQRRWAVRHGALIDLATARAQRGDPHGALDAIQPALELDPTRRTARLSRRLRNLRNVVENSPYRAAPVGRTLAAAVDDWTATALTGPRPRALPAGVAATSQADAPRAAGQDRAQQHGQ